MSSSKFSRWTLIRLTVITFILMIIVVGFIHHRQLSFNSLQEFRVTRFYMDTYIEVILVAPRGEREKANRSLEDAFAIFEKLDRNLSFQNPESLLSRANKQSEMELSDPALRYLIFSGIETAQETGGAFDPALGAVKNLYPIGKENPHPPSEEAIRKAMTDSGYAKVKIDGNTLEKPQNLLIDLGGIAKGYGVEQAAKKLEQEGFQNFIVNGGGNVRAHGMNLSGKPWKIGVEHPRKQGAIVTVLTLDNRAVATSGDYQRYFFYEGTRYHHIIDAKTGKPARNAISATIITPDAMTADIYSTAAFVMGRDKGIPFLEEKGFEGIIFDEKGYSVTKGLKGLITVEYKTEN